MRQEDEANEAGGMLVAHVMIEVVIWRAPDQPGNPATGGGEEDGEEEKEEEERGMKAGSSERVEDASELPPLTLLSISLSPTHTPAFALLQIALH